MRAASVVVAALLVFVAAPARAEPAPGEAGVAAVLDGEPVTLAVLDDASSGKADRLRARLREVAADTLDALIDDRLALELPPPSTEPVEVSDEEIAAFRAERAQDFEGPYAPEGTARDPEVQRAAVRYYLEEEARQRVRSEALAALRASHEIVRRLPAASELERPLDPQREVGRVDGKAIRAAALEARAALPLYRLRGELARERTRRLEDWVDARLLGREAARRDTSVRELLDSAWQPPSDAELRDYLAAEVAAGRPAPDPDRARPYLAFRAAHAARESLLRDLRAQAKLEVRLWAPAPPRLPLHTEDAPALGPADGSRLVVYTNYRCRACRQVHEELDHLLAADAGVRIVFRDWLPHYDPVALEAALLARCAHRAGRFAAMRQALLRREPPDFGRSFTDADPGLRGLAAAAGLDAETLQSCAAQDAVRAAVLRDSEQARALGFERAPSFVAEGMPLSGVQSAAGLARALRDALADSAHKAQTPAS